jgi:hypothetical protein
MEDEDGAAIGAFFDFCASASGSGGGKVPKS